MMGIKSFTVVHGQTHTGMQIALNAAGFVSMFSDWRFKCNIQVISEEVREVHGATQGHVFTVPPGTTMLS